MLFSFLYFFSLFMSETRVHVTEGTLKGVVVDGYNVRYLAFRGIPYAKPPVGELRFKDPEPAKSWSGERDASKYGNVCVQVDLDTHKIVGDEDCLYLNVYTTKINLLKKRPVMVWIHGGGYFVGSGNPYWYGPDHIVQKDVVLVTLNYRLSVLGFLNLNDKVATGNQGLKDTVLALKWVKKNILKFGGDPDNVTIFGESAGAGTVHHLALSPFAKGLFHKVIAQSGVVANPWAFVEKPSAGFRMAEKLGNATSDPKIAYEFLKTIDAKTLTETSQVSLPTEEERLSFEPLFTPSLDTKISSKPFFAEHPKEYLKRGVQIPFLLGFNRNEGIFFIRSSFFGGYMSKEAIEQVNDDFKKGIVSSILKTLPEIGITVEELRHLYFGNEEISEETLNNYAYFIGDEFFVRGIMKVAEQQKSSGGSTYLYKFDYESETSVMRKVLNIGLPGVCHTEDLSYLFRPEMAKIMNWTLPEVGTDDYKVVNHFTQMWTDFAKTGNPTPTTNLWLPLTNPTQNEDYNYLNLDLNPQMKTFRPGKERWNWESRK
ncbi:PREDICTED: juvenile hormone esterase-like isoform X2 [Wasmannia auropunctata]|uniref:juvenile hormone esterase-like isoform X2 n=1 Tax=Wasmannia auropunctata TaxID=64793 RepID=UPI0005ED8B00|nr:PREDICTED: juvenile hormone esterase-like isoform X2 [Wasmannia auropunctata]